MQVRSTAEIAAAAKGRRLDLGLSQTDLAERAGLSRKWISEFEAGKPRAELGLVLRVLEELGLRLDVVLAPVRRRSTRVVDLDRLLEEHRRR